MWPPTFTSEREKFEELSLNPSPEITVDIA